VIKGVKVRLGVQDHRGPTVLAFKVLKDNQGSKVYKVGLVPAFRGQLVVLATRAPQEKLALRVHQAHEAPRGRVVSRAPRAIQV
jgi:hypothetical protein